MQSSILHRTTRPPQQPIIQAWDTIMAHRLLSHNHTRRTHFECRREETRSTRTEDILCVTAVLVTKRMGSVSVWVRGVSVKETLCRSGVLGGWWVVCGFVSARAVLVVLGELVFVAIVVLILKLVDVSTNYNGDV